MNSILKPKTNVFLVAALVSGLILIAIISLWSGNLVLEGQFEDRCRDDAVRAGEALLNEVADSDRLSERAALTENLLGGRLVVFSSSGAVVYGDRSGMDDEIIWAVLAGAPAFEYISTTLEGKQALTGQPLLTADGLVGAVILRRSIQPLKDQQFLLSWLVGLVIVMTGLLAWILLGRSQQNVLDPVRRTTDGIYSLTEERAPDWPELGSGQEIGRLIQAIQYFDGYRKKREDRGDREYQLLDQIINRLEEGVLLISKMRRIVYANQATGDLLGYNHSDLSGEPFLEIIKDYDLGEVIQKAAEGEDFSGYAIRTLLPSAKMLEADGFHIHHQNEDEPAVLMILEDVSRIQNLIQLRSEFVANVSHELRTPLTAIKGFAETILDSDEEDKSNVRRFVEIIENEADRLTRLIDDLLDLSRIESGKIRLDFRRTDIHKVIEDTVEKLRPQLEQMEIRLELEVDENLPLILADPDRIAQVMINYIDNSMKYTHKGGKIQIQAGQADGDVMVSVTDNGVGIPTPDLERVFERFYRVDKARARTSGGTGLGLAIVKHIIEAHGGEVFVQSTPGEGSTFGFRLPQEP